MQKCEELDNKNTALSNDLATTAEHLNGTKAAKKKVCEAPWIDLGC